MESMNPKINSLNPKIESSNTMFRACRIAPSSKMSNRMDITAEVQGSDFLKEWWTSDAIPFPRYKYPCGISTLVPCWRRNGAWRHWLVDYFQSSHCIMIILFISSHPVDVSVCGPIRLCCDMDLWWQWKYSMDQIHRSSSLTKNWPNFRS